MEGQRSEDIYDQWRWNGTNVQVSSLQWSEALSREYVAPVSAQRLCATHGQKLIRWSSNISGPCPVEFGYLYPKNYQDDQRCMYVSANRFSIVLNVEKDHFKWIQKFLAQKYESTIQFSIFSAANKIKFWMHYSTFNFSALNKLNYWNQNSILNEGEVWMLNSSWLYTNISITYCLNHIMAQWYYVIAFHMAITCSHDHNQFRKHLL